MIRPVQIDFGSWNGKKVAMTLVDGSRGIGVLTEEQFRDESGRTSDFIQLVTDKGPNFPIIYEKQVIRSVEAYVPGVSDEWLKATDNNSLAVQPVDLADEQPPVESGLSDEDTIDEVPEPDPVGAAQVDGVTWRRYTHNGHQVEIADKPGGGVRCHPVSHAGPEFEAESVADALKQVPKLQ